MVTPPIYYPQYPQLPIIDIEDIPDHPDLPDMNRGYWATVVSGGVASPAFVTYLLEAVNLPTYTPRDPPESSQPGSWVIVYVGPMPNNVGGPRWAWIPSAPESGGGDGEHPDHELPGDQPVVDPR